VHQYGPQKNSLGAPPGRGVHRHAIPPHPIHVFIEKFGTGFRMLGFPSDRWSTRWRSNTLTLRYRAPELFQYCDSGTESSFMALPHQTCGCVAAIPGTFDCLAALQPDTAPAIHLASTHYHDASPNLFSPVTDVCYKARCCHFQYQYSHIR
jgi:hypothetical protein